MLLWDKMSRGKNKLITDIKLPHNKFLSKPFLWNFLLDNSYEYKKYTNALKVKDKLSTIGNSICTIEWFWSFDYDLNQGWIEIFAIGKNYVPIKCTLGWKEKQEHISQ